MNALLDYSIDLNNIVTFIKVTIGRREDLHLQLNSLFSGVGQILYSHGIN